MAVVGHERENTKEHGQKRVPLGQPHCGNGVRVVKGKEQESESRQGARSNDLLGLRLLT